MNEKFRRIFTQVFDALLITDKTGRIVDVNTAACNLLGYEKEELSQLYLRDIHTEKEFKKMVERELGPTFKHELQFYLGKI